MTTPTVDRAWLHRFALVTRATTLATASVVNSCVLSTRVGLSVLDAVGVRAIAQPVFVVVYNRKGYQLTQQRVPVSEWPDDAHSLGIDARNVFEGNGGWNGHLVLVVRLPGQPRTLIDLTADQFDRPARNMVVGGPVFMDLPSGSPWTPRDPLYTTAGDEQDLLISYRPMPPQHPAAQTWRGSPDWTVPETRLEEWVSGILTKVDDLGQGAAGSR